MERCGSETSGLDHCLWEVFALKKELKSEERFLEAVVWK